MQEPTLSIVIPAYNEAESLAELTGEIRSVLADTGWTYEVILVDDGSGDDSLEVLLELAASDSQLRIFRQPENQGQSAAIAVGFAHACGEVVVTMDADLQNDPRDIPRLLAAMEGFDLVSGVRSERKDRWIRRVSSRFANRVRGRVLGDAITDVGCSLKAYRAELLGGVPVFNGMHRFLPALVQMRGARVKEIAVNHRPRRFGSSSYGVHNRLWRGIVDLMGVRWLQRRRVDIEHAEEVLTWKRKHSG